MLVGHPGLHAMIRHRLAHPLHGLGVPLRARMVARLAHGDTGVDLHPGALIGSHFFIDHGTGVVIGETAAIGENGRIHQAATLGAKRFETDADGAIGGDVGLTHSMPSGGRIAQANARDDRIDETAAPK